MVDTYTPNLNLNKVEVGASRDTWGGKLNSNADAIDTAFGTMQRQIQAVGANSGGPAPQGRLSFQSGVPTMFADVNSSVACYYTPYLGNSVPVYDPGAKTFVASVFAELSQQLTDAVYSPAASVGNAVYDLFVWRDKVNAADVKANNALVLGDPILRLSRGYPWNSLTSRGTGAGTSELSRSGAYLTNRNDITNGPKAGQGTYVGSVYVSASNRLDWTLGGLAAGGYQIKMHCYNYYNRISYVGKTSDTSGTHGSYNGTRPYNNSQNNSASVLIGVQEDGVEVFMKAAVNNGGSNNPTLANIGLGVNQSTTFDYQTRFNDNVSRFAVSQELSVPLPPSLGRSVFYMVENAGSNSFNWTDNSKDQWLAVKISL